MTMINNSQEKFSVCQFFVNGFNEYVERFVSPERAVETAAGLTQSVGAKIGTTRRVIITDSDDSIAFEWIYGQGVVFPKQ